MDRETLSQAIKRGPVRVTMNDGSQYLIPNMEMAIVSDIAAIVLYRAEDGKMRTHSLALVCMVRVEEFAEAT